MRIFEGRKPERDIAGAMRAMAEGGADWSDSSELDRLANMLAKRGVRFERKSHGVFNGIVFESPHGTVAVVYGPATMGAEDGLLEACCSDWDMSPRGNLTANEIVLEYLHGGWM